MTTGGPDTRTDRDKLATLIANERPQLRVIRNPGPRARSRRRPPQLRPLPGPGDAG